jgi:exopolysaccharide biosynthesis polyprenyl glycosylphosphotransferase
MGARALPQDAELIRSGQIAPEVLGAMQRHSDAKLRLARVVLMMLDAGTVGLAFLLAYHIRFLSIFAGIFDPRGATDAPFYSLYVYLLIPLWIVLFAMFRLYDPSVLFGGLQEYMSVFNACTAGIMLLVLVSFLDTKLQIARGWLLLAWLLTIFLVMLERFTFRRVIYGLRSKGRFMTPTYIVGANSEGVAIAEQLASVPMAGINIIGFLDDHRSVGAEVLPGLIVHGPTSRAEELVERFGIERLIVATSGVQRENLLDLFRRFVNSETVSVWMSSGMYEILTTGVRMQDVGSVPLVSVNRVRLTGANVVMKALLDYFGALVLLVVLSPLFLAIIIMMKRTDPGPIIYRRRVVGVGGKEFDAFKFRTMVVNSQQVLEELMARDPEARAEYQQYYKLKNDPRITRIGHFLRKTSLDELPQLINVLRGEMSLVGPRMITMEEVQRYGQWGLNLHTVKPGITGLWQTSGRSELTYEERVRLDMRYIRNYSIWLDVQILLQTIPAVILSKGAY